MAAPRRDTRKCMPDAGCSRSIGSSTPTLRIRLRERERERENYGNRDPLLEGGGQKADRPILPPAKVTPDKPGFLRALAR